MEKNINNQNKKQLNANAYQIKMFMTILMVLDHLPHIPGLFPPIWVGIFHALTRCVAAWFGYNAVESYVHTRNPIRFNVRLFAWAIIMQIGNYFFEYILRSKDIHINNNIFLTLAMGVLILNIIADPLNIFSKMHNKAIYIIKILVVILFTFIGIFITEGGTVVIPFVLISYLWRESPKKRNIGYIILSIIHAVLSLSGSFYSNDSMNTLIMALYNSDWLFITVLPFIYLYNGERGKNNKFTKYFFYVFYPAHLWIIALVSYFVQ